MILPDVNVRPRTSDEMLLWIPAFRGNDDLKTRSKQHRFDTERQTGIAQPSVEGTEDSTVIGADSQM